MRARAALIALVTGLGLLLAVACCGRPEWGPIPAPAAAPAAATGFHAVVTARAELPEKPGEPVRVRLGAVDVDAPVAPIRPESVLGRRADIDGGWRRRSAA